jgi:maltodextrin utilization protein YvdJ
MVAIAAIGFFCLVMTIPFTIGLLLLLLFLKLAQFACFGLAKFMECIALRGTDKTGVDMEALELVKRQGG